MVSTSKSTHKKFTIFKSRRDLLVMCCLLYKLVLQSALNKTLKDAGHSDYNTAFKRLQTHFIEPKNINSKCALTFRRCVGIFRIMCSLYASNSHIITELGIFRLLYPDINCTDWNQSGPQTPGKQLYDPFRFPSILRTSCTLLRKIMSCYFRYCHRKESKKLVYWLTRIT